MLKPLTSTLEGVARCTRYAFGPNKLRMCGPDQQGEIAAYLSEHQADQGLTGLLVQFKTLYPYLQTIAHANGIRDPFDERVVEAYWVGNELLETVPNQTFYRHLGETLELKRKMPQHSFSELAEKLPQGARMHHSFHVFNVYKRTGNMEVLHTLESMDACRVSWGKITAIEGPKVTLQRKPLKLVGHALVLGEPEPFTITRLLDTDDVLDEARVGQWLTLHWYRPCEIVSNANVRHLEWYTKKHLALANQTL